MGAIGQFDSSPGLRTVVRESKRRCTNCGVKIYSYPEPEIRELCKDPCVCGRYSLVADRYCGGCGLRLVAPEPEPSITQG